MEKPKQCCGCPQDEQAANYDKLNNIIDLYKSKSGALIQVLHLAQQIFGYLPLEVQQHISKNLGLPLAEVAGVVSFYSFFSTEPRGKHSIRICMGTACYVRGGQKLVEGFMEKLNIPLGGITADRKFSLDVARCIGACGIAPAVMVDNTVYRKVKTTDLDDIIAKY